MWPNLDEIKHRLLAAITFAKFEPILEAATGGIAPEDRSRLFQRFVQTKGPHSPGGVGLGLYITRLLVEALDGRIWIESKLGHGSTFNFTLPIAAFADRDQDQEIL